MDLQLFAVIIIAILVAIVLIRGVYRFFFVKRRVVAVSDARAVSSTPAPMTGDRGEIPNHYFSSFSRTSRLAAEVAFLPAGVYSSSIRDA